MYGDFEMVRLLVENGANVNQRATGRFFMPEDQKKGKTKYTTYEGEFVYIMKAEKQRFYVHVFVESLNLRNILQWVQEYALS